MNYQNQNISKNKTPIGDKKPKWEAPEIIILSVNHTLGGTSPSTTENFFSHS